MLWIVAFMTLRAFIFEAEEIIRDLLLLVFEKRGYECIAFERAGICVMNLESG